MSQKYDECLETGYFRSMLEEVQDQIYLVVFPNIFSDSVSDPFLTSAAYE